MIQRLLTQVKLNVLVDCSESQIISHVGLFARVPYCTFSVPVNALTETR